MISKLRSILLAGIFATPFIPLIINTPTYYSLVTGKNFAFRILVEILFIGWLLLIIAHKKYRPRFSWIGIAILTFVATIAVANIFGENPTKSFWGDFERMEGLITLLHLSLYFLVVTSLLTTQKLWDYFFNSIIAAGCLTSLLGLLQLTGLAAIQRDAGRIDATFGNSGWFAAYVLILIFVTLMMLVRHHGQMGRWVYGGILIFQVIILYFTGTRSAILGLIGGTLAIAVCIILFEHTQKNLRKYALVAILVPVILVIGFFSMRDHAFVKSNQQLNRFNDLISQGIKQQSRYNLWLTAVDGFKEKPILGWGQENFNLVYYMHYRPAMYERDFYEPRSDRAHNVFLEWFVAGGLLGGLAYIALYIACIYYLWFHKEASWSISEKSILTGLFAGYVINNFFLFDNIATYILFFSLLAYIHVRSMPEQGKVRKEKHTASTYTFQLMAIPAVCIGIALIYVVNGKAVQASYETYKGMMLFPADIEQSLSYFQKAISRESYGTHQIQTKLAALAMSPEVQTISEPLKSTFYDATKSVVESQLRQLASDPHALYQAGLYYLAIEDYERAYDVLTKADTLAPGKQTILFKLRDASIMKGDFQGAYEIAKKMYLSEPRYTQARIAYAISVILHSNLSADTVEFTDAMHFLEPQTTYVFDRSAIPYTLKVGHRKIQDLKKDIPQ